MPRAPFQVLVLPYRVRLDGSVSFAVFQRRDMDAWQGISGGGEEGESPEQAARREAFEEARLPSDAILLQLDAVASIPRTVFRDHRLWAPNIYIIPEYSFGIEATRAGLTLSPEHTRYEWLDYESAWHRLTWDSNRAALWELHERLSGSGWNG